MIKYPRKGSIIIGINYDKDIVWTMGKLIEDRIKSLSITTSGEDFDNRLAEFCVQEFKKKTKLLLHE